MAKSTLSWTDINPAELSPDAQQAYADYKAAYRTAKEAKGKFEAIARLSIPAPNGFEVKFAYNFGKLSIALAEAEGPKAAKSSSTLAEWIAQQQTAGQRT